MRARDTSRADDSPSATDDARNTDDAPDDTSDTDDVIADVLASAATSPYDVADLPVDTDTETSRTDVSLLPDEIAYMQLDIIRERRLKAAAVYAEVLEMRKRVRSDRVRDMLDKQSALYDKDIARCDAIIIKLELRANKIRALRLELDALN